MKENCCGGAAIVDNPKQPLKIEIMLWKNKRQHNKEGWKLMNLGR